MRWFSLPLRHNNPNHAENRSTWLSGPFSVLVYIHKQSVIGIVTKYTEWGCCVIGEEETSRFPSGRGGDIPSPAPEPKYIQPLLPGIDV